MSGIDRITAERRRQVEEEGWTPEHDNGHDAGELAAAAAYYANFASLQEEGGHPTVTPARRHDVAPPPRWPWDWDWWKPSEDPVRNLEKAGALIAAEIDRLRRTTPPESEELV